MLGNIESDRHHQVLLQGWEEFHQPVDRIVSIEAFEHFGHERYKRLFKSCYENLPDDGRMVIQSSTSFHPYELSRRGQKITFEMARFIKFMYTEIFPGGRLPSAEMMVEHGERVGFTRAGLRSLHTHYIKTLGLWADALEANRTKPSR